MNEPVITRPLTRAEREALQRRKCEQLRLGKLLARAYDEGQLKEMLERLKSQKPARRGPERRSDETNSAKTD